MLAVGIEPYLQSVGNVGFGGNAERKDNVK